MKSGCIKSPLNYTGGKHRLLPQLLPLFPERPRVFVDLFCGGANVGINMNCDLVIYNDRLEHIVNLYRMFAGTGYDRLVLLMDRIVSKYGLSDTFRHGYDAYACNSRDGLGKFNKDPYMRLRNDFNASSMMSEEYYVMFYALIVFGFNNQIRFTRDGKFNIPVGKRDFNGTARKNLKLFAERLGRQNKKFLSSDFRNLDVSQLASPDFVYCDPPYLIATATYNEMNGWTVDDDADLHDFLDALDRKGIRFALSNVTHHKGKKNSLLLEWSRKYETHFMHCRYENASYHGKGTDKPTQEVLVTNY